MRRLRLGRVHRPLVLHRFFVDAEVGLRELRDPRAFVGRERRRIGGAGELNKLVAVVDVRQIRHHARFGQEPLQRGLTEVRLIFQSYPLQAALKEVMARVSGDESWRLLLPPNQALAPAQRAELARRLGQLPQMQPILRAAA